jgi:hypothetical protein
MPEQNQNNLNPLNTPNKHGWFANHHLLGALFIAIVFGAVVWLVYYMSYPPMPEPDQQAQIPDSGNWKTYVDKDYGFEIDYPSNGTVEEMADSGFKTITINYRNEDESIPLTEGEFWVSIYVAERQHEFRPCTDIYQPKQIELDGAIVYKGLTMYELGGAGPGLCTQKGGLGYYISTLDGHIDDSLANRILDSFKFTEPTDSALFTSQELGIQLRYPNDWTPNNCGWPTVVYFNVICESDAPITMSVRYDDEDKIEDEIKEHQNTLDNALRTNINLNGINAVQIQGDTKEYEGPGPRPGSKVTNVFFEGNNRVYILSLFQNQETYSLNDYNKDLRLVLSDIKLIDPVLFSVRSHGGLCVTGKECESLFVFNTDGKYTYTVGGKYA